MNQTNKKLHFIIISHPLKITFLNFFETGISSFFKFFLFSQKLGHINFKKSLRVESSRVVLWQEESLLKMQFVTLGNIEPEISHSFYISSTKSLLTFLYLSQNCIHKMFLKYCVWILKPNENQEYFLFEIGIHSDDAHHPLLNGDSIFFKIRTSWML